MHTIRPHRLHKIRDDVGAVAARNDVHLRHRGRLRYVRIRILGRSQLHPPLQPAQRGQVAEGVARMDGERRSLAASGAAQTFAAEITSSRVESRRQHPHRGAFGQLGAVQPRAGHVLTRGVKTEGSRVGAIAAIAQIERHRRCRGL